MRIYRSSSYARRSRRWSQASLPKQRSANRTTDIVSNAKIESTGYRLTFPCEGYRAGEGTNVKRNQRQSGSVKRICGPRLRRTKGNSLARGGRNGETSTFKSSDVDALMAAALASQNPCRWPPAIRKALLASLPTSPKHDSRRRDQIGLISSLHRWHRDVFPNCCPKKQLAMSGSFSKGAGLQQHFCFQRQASTPHQWHSVSLLPPTTSIWFVHAQRRDSIAPFARVHVE